MLKGGANAATRWTQLPLGKCAVLLLSLLVSLLQTGLSSAVAVSPQGATKGQDLALVRSLLQRAHIPLEQVQDIDRVTAKSAFCNALYRVKTLDTDDKEMTYMAKVFSPLAASRMQTAEKDADKHETTSRLFRIDRLAADHNLGPDIYASIDTAEAPALLMQDCPGRALTEQDLQEDSAVVRVAAEALAHLHGLDQSSLFNTSSGSPNMLWQSCNVLMQQYADPEWKVEQDDTTWTFDLLVDCIKRHQAELEQMHDELLVTNSGHGDCKPSNLLLRKEGDSLGIRFLDLELAGTHYVAYDLAKLWRSPGPMTPNAQRQRRIFVETYTACSEREHVTASMLQEQMNRLLPLTWLEAAAFFVAMSSSSSRSSSERAHWDALALDRLQSYKNCLPNPSS